MPATEIKDPCVVIKKSSNGGAVYLQQEGKDKPEWYYLTEKTLKYAARLNPDTKINISMYERDGKKYVSFFKFLTTKSSSGYKTSRSYGASNSSFNDADRQDLIVKQTVMKAASELVSSLENDSIDVALNSWSIAYDHMYEKLHSAANSKNTTSNDDEGLVEVSTPEDEPSV